MTILKKNIIISLALGGSLFLGGCLGGLDSGSDNGGNASASNNVLSEAADVLFDLPSSVSAGKTASLAKRSAGDEDGDIWDAYEMVPLYVNMADEAKEGVRDFIRELESYDIPEQLDMVEDGNRIQAVTKDSTVDGVDYRFVAVKITPEGAEDYVLALRYLRSSKSEIKGEFHFRGFEGDEAGAQAHIAFSNWNEESEGRRMVVTFATDEVDANDPNAPQVVRVAAVSKGDRIFVAGASYHPDFEEALFGEAQPMIYAFVAAANTKKDVAAMSVAFAPADKALNNPSLFEDYAVNEIVLRAIVSEAKQKFLENLAVDSIKAQIYVIKNAVSLAMLEDSATWVTIQAYEPTAEDVNALEVSDYKTFLEANALVAVALAADEENPNRELLDLLLLSRISNPVFFRPGGKYVADPSKEIGEDFGIKATDLAEVDMLDPVEVVGVDFEEF